MTFAKDSLIEALRLRYDYYSASSIFDLARDRAGLADKPAFDTTELRAFRTALEAVGDRVTTVLSELDRWLDSAKPEPVKPEPKAEPKPEPKQVAKQDKKEPAKVEKPDVRPEVETIIVVTGVPAKEGEDVLVCGGDADLGDWDPARARKMARKGDAWTTTIKLAPDAKVAFKFLKRTADGEVVWEDGDDRNLVAKQRVEATWRQP